MTNSNDDIDNDNDIDEMLEYALDSSIQYEKYKKQLIKAQIKYRMANKDTDKFKKRASKASRKFYEAHKEYWQVYYQKKKAKLCELDDAKCNVHIHKQINMTTSELLDCN